MRDGSCKGCIPPVSGIPLLLTKRTMQRVLTGLSLDLRKRIGVVFDSNGAYEEGGGLSGGTSGGD